MTDSSRAKRYHRTRRLLSVAGFGLDLGVLCLLLFTGLTITFRNWAYQVNGNPWLAVLIYLLLFGLLTQVFGLPLDFISGYWLEHRYGLSNLTLRGWVKDRLKGFAVGGILILLAVEFLYAAIRRWPEHWWIICAVVFVGVFVLLANLAPVLIFPVFFKFKPLENPTLTGRLLQLSQKAGTRVKGVFEWQLSAKSKKANAALVGLGNTRRIILSDTLLAHFREDEIEAVLAHEFGHHVHHHVFRSIAIQASATVLGFYLVSVAIQKMSHYFGFAGQTDFANLPLLALVTTALSLVLLPAINVHSRTMERQADAYALQVIPARSAFISSMEKLAVLNLAERKPHPWVEFLFHSHPSIDKRIAQARKFSS